MIIVSAVLGIVLFGIGLSVDGGLKNCSIATTLCPYLWVPAMIVWMRYWKEKYLKWSGWMNMLFSGLISLAGLSCLFFPLKLLGESTEMLVIFIAAAISLAAVMGAVEILFRVIGLFEKPKTE